MIKQIVHRGIRGVAHIVCIKHSVTEKHVVKSGFVKSGPCARCCYSGWQEVRAVGRLQLLCAVRRHQRPIGSQPSGTGGGTERGRSRGRPHNIYMIKDTEKCTSSRPDAGVGEAPVKRLLPFSHKPERLHGFYVTGLCHYFEGRWFSLIYKCVLLNNSSFNSAPYRVY